MKWAKVITARGTISGRCGQISDGVCVEGGAGDVEGDLAQGPAVRIGGVELLVGQGAQPYVPDLSEAA